MTAAEQLTRQAIKADIVRHARLLGIMLAIVVGLGGSYLLGRSHGRAAERDAQVNARLDTNAKKQVAATVHRDSTKQVAAVAQAKSDTARHVARVARAAFTITSDSTIAVHSVVVDTAAGVTRDSTVTLSVPPVVVASTRASDELAARDSVTILSLHADVRALEVKDSLHVEREQLLEEKAGTAEHRGFWRGVKVGAGAVGGVLVAIAVVVIVH